MVRRARRPPDRNGRLATQFSRVPAPLRCSCTPRSARCARSSASLRYRRRRSPPPRAVFSTASIITRAASGAGTECSAGGRAGMRDRRHRRSLSRCRRSSPGARVVVHNARRLAQQRVLPTPGVDQQMLLPTRRRRARRRCTVHGAADPAGARAMSPCGCAGRDRCSVRSMPRGCRVELPIARRDVVGSCDSPSFRERADIRCGSGLGNAPRSQTPRERRKPSWCSKVSTSRGGSTASTIRLSVLDTRLANPAAAPARRTYTNCAKATSSAVWARPATGLSLRTAARSVDTEQLGGTQARSADDSRRSVKSSRR